MTSRTRLSRLSAWKAGWSLVSCFSYPQRLKLRSSPLYTSTYNSLVPQHGVRFAQWGLELVKCSYPLFFAPTARSSWRLWLGALSIPLPCLQELRAVWPMRVEGLRFHSYPSSISHAMFVSTTNVDDHILVEFDKWWKWHAAKQVWVYVLRRRRICDSML